MLRYNPPLRDMQFLLEDLLNAGQLAELPGYEDASLDTLKAVIEEGGKLARDVILPTNGPGDIEGCQYDAETKEVKTPKGYIEAYKAFVEGGWPAMSAPVEHGGQGLPHLLKFVLDEMICSTNMAFGMYPGLSHGAVTALHHHADKELQDRFLPNLISGEWTGTMCLTEPQCGTDLRLIRTKAEPNSDGSYDITGTKIWITGGEHDLADNIVHLVLAKLPGAPESTKGISMFIVPKFIPESGERNAAFCGGLEHKMGIKGSATCVMNFEGAKGWLVGEANKGMSYMFTMMNGARLMVGMQGLGIAEAAWQIALDFSKERLQSRALSGPKHPELAADPIHVHPDVRRMLLQQKVINEGCRALAYWVGMNLDISHAHPDEKQREAADDIVQLLTPVVKAFLTDEGYTNANWAVQVLGGSGFTTDWGVEQLVRDARIARIYEGTNGIQALDLIGRKLSIKGGKLIKRFFAIVQGYLKENERADYSSELGDLLAQLQDATMWVAANGMKDPDQAGAAATPYLRLMAYTAIGFMWHQMNAVAKKKAEAAPDDVFYQAKIKSAKFYFEKATLEASSLIADIKSGKEALMAHSIDELSAS